MGTVAFDLLVGGDGAEDYFGELAFCEGPVCDTSASILIVLVEGLKGMRCTQRPQAVS